MSWINSFAHILSAGVVSVLSFLAGAAVIIFLFAEDPEPLGVSIVLPPPLDMPPDAAAKPAMSTDGGAVPGDINDNGSAEAAGPAITAESLDAQSLDVQPPETVELADGAAGQGKTPDAGNDEAGQSKSQELKPEDSANRPQQDEGRVTQLSTGRPPTRPMAKADDVLRPGEQLAARSPDVPVRRNALSGQSFAELAGLIGSADAPPWLRYAAPLPPGSEGAPLIAIVIDDFGLNQRALKQALALPGPLTLAFLPYAPNLSVQTAETRAAGHEIIVHVPMQPLDPSLDPGPNVLDSALTQGDLSVRLHWVLSRFGGYVGINNHMGSAFTADSDGMRTVMSSLAGRGLLFLDSGTTSDTVGPRMAREAGVPYARRNVFLDNERNGKAIRAQFSSLEQVARRRGYAVAIGHPYDSTLGALADWLPTLRQRGIVLASLAHIVIRRQAEASSSADNSALPNPNNSARPSMDRPVENTVRRFSFGSTLPSRPAAGMTEP